MLLIAAGTRAPRTSFFPLQPYLCHIYSKSLTEKQMRPNLYQVTHVRASTWVRRDVRSSVHCEIHTSRAPLRHTTRTCKYTLRSHPRANSSISAHTCARPGEAHAEPVIPSNIASTSDMVGLIAGIVLQHRSNTPQNATACIAVAKRMSGIGGIPAHGRTPRKMSSVTARSLRRCGYGRSLVATYTW